DKVPVRENEWDNRHFWRVSNAEHLAMSDDAGMINLSHFAVYDVTGRDAETLMEYACVAKVAGDTAVGKGIYTHFLDRAGGIRADLTVIRLASDKFRVIDGADAGNRDYVWLKRMAENKGWDVYIEDRSDHMACLGLWGPNARKMLQAIADKPEALELDNFPFATTMNITLRGIPVLAFRISYVGESGWELHVPFSYGLSLWDLVYDQGATPVGVETYANTRRLEKSLRLQNADLLTEYNLVEADLARPKVKAADFHGKSAYLAQRECEFQSAYLCTMTMTDNIDSKGIARYPVGQWPILDPNSNEVLIDDMGRRSNITSIAFGPSVGKNIALGYLPKD
ncbi:MAG: aminomethyltransferase family protein, partial [Pseudomonadota bacterium]|nr:aminomethyltransferase family protein [Pseudomonadota bacterium]